MKSVSLALSEQGKPLRHAEAVLLVNDDEAELFEHDVILEERMSADGDVGPPENEILESAPPFLRGEASREERDPEAER